MSYIGLDIGITGTKAIVFSIDGKIIAKSYYDYGDEYKENLRHKGEQNPKHILNGIKKVIGDCNTLSLKDKPKTIAVSVSGDDMFPADKRGNPLFNVIAGFDSRGFEYREFVAQKMDGVENLFSVTGQRVDTDIPALIRILWMKNNIPDLFKKMWKFLCWQSYINYYLTGKAVTDYSNAARYLTFDINSKCWSEKILNTFDIPIDTMPEAVPSGTVVGKIEDNVARGLNLPKDLVVVAGGFDQATAALGAGVASEGIFSLGMGTVLCSHWMVEDFKKINKSDYVYCNYLIKNKFFGLLLSLNGCGIINWFFDSIGEKEKDLHKDDIYDYFNSAMDSYPSKLFFMPHFIGGPNPYNDPKSKGVLIGLNLKTEKKEILKAIYEGIAFDLKSNYENLIEKTDLKINEIRAVGGGSRSDVWVKILANILDIKFSLLEIDEGGCIACAMLGAVAVGDFKDIDEASGNFINPEKKQVDLFKEKFGVYKKIYSSVKEFNHYLS